MNDEAAANGTHLVLSSLSFEGGVHFVVDGTEEKLKASKWLEEFGV
jgi:hypothetical protein